QFIEGLEMKTQAASANAWPRTTFTSETTLHLNGDDIRLVPLPPAHTDGDVIVRFEKADVIHGADLFFTGSSPLIAYASGCSDAGAIRSYHLCRLVEARLSGAALPTVRTFCSRRRSNSGPGSNPAKYRSCLL